MITPLTPCPTRRAVVRVCGFLPVGAPVWLKPVRPRPVRLHDADRSQAQAPRAVDAVLPVAQQDAQPQDVEMTPQPKPPVVAAAAPAAATGTVRVVAGREGEESSR